MTQDTAVELRIRGAGDPMRQQQQELLQRHLQQQRLEQQLQQHQLHQHLQRQQQQHQVQQQLQHQWSPQLQPTLYPSYSYPLPSAVSPSLLQSAATYARPSVAATPAAMPAQPDISGAASGPPPLSLRDILHILGESVAVLECLRVLLLQFLQWGAEVGALLRASSFLQHLTRFFAAAGASAFRRLKRGFFSLSSPSNAHQQQPLRQLHSQEEQQLSPQPREPLLQQAWQLVMSPVTKLLSAAPTENDAGVQVGPEDHASKQKSALSLFSKTAATAGTIVATSTAATRRGAGLLKLLPGRLGALIYCVLVLGVFYRIYLQWRKYRRLLKRYRRLAARMSVQRANRVEEAEEDLALLAADLECGTAQKSVTHDEEARACDEIKRAAEISSRADTMETVSGAGSVLRKDASVQTEYPGSTLPLYVYQQPSASTHMLTDGIASFSEQQQPQHVEAAAPGYPRAMPVPLWAAAATSAPFLSAANTASLPRDKKDVPAASAECYQHAAPRLQTAAGSTLEVGTGVRLHARQQEDLHTLLTLAEKNVAARAPRDTAADSQPPTKTAAALPSSTSVDAALGSPGAPGPDVGVIAGAVDSSVDSGRVVAAAPDSKMPAPAANTISKEVAERSLQAEGSSNGELLLRQFLQARAERVKDPSKGGLLATSVKKFAAACTTGAETAPAETATKAEAATVGERREDSNEPVSPQRGEGEAGEGRAARGAATSDEAGHKLKAAVARVGAEELSKACPHLRQRAASWADGVTPQASTHLLHASRKAVAALAAARLLRAKIRMRPSESVIKYSVVQKNDPSSGASKDTLAATLARGMASSLPVTSAASGIPAAPAVGADAQISPAASTAADVGGVSNPSLSEVAAGSLVSPGLPAAGRAAPSGALIAAAAAADFGAVEAAQMKEFVEEQLRCYKAGEKRTTPAFQENPFLRLCRLQRQRDQQEKQRQQLLEREFTRTDIPPWERGSILEGKEGEQSVYTSYWKAPYFPQPAAPPPATPWSSAPTLLVPAICKELPQEIQLSSQLQKRQEQAPQQQAAQEQGESQRVSEQPQKKEKLLQQQQENWLPTQVVHPLGDSAISCGSEPPPAPLTQPVHSQVLANTLAYSKATVSPLDTQRRILQSSTSTGTRTPPRAAAAMVTDGASTWLQPAILPLSSGGSPDPQVQNGRSISCAREARRSSAAGEGQEAGGVAAGAEAAAGPTAAAATATEAATGHQNLAPPAVTDLSVRGGYGSVAGRPNGTSQCLSAAVFTQRKSQNYPSADDGTGGMGELLGFSKEQLFAAAGNEATGVSNLAAEAERPPARRANDFAATALAVRRQQRSQLWQMFRTHTLHQQLQEQPQQQTQQETQLQAQQQVRGPSQQQAQQEGRKHTVKNRTPSTASDADLLAELAAAVARDGQTGRYYYPELYV